MPKPHSSASTTTGNLLTCRVVKCHSVHHADIDGDGRADLITIEVPPRPRRAQYFSGWYRVQARLATGELAATPVFVHDWPAFGDRDLWFRAAQLDGHPGDELLLRNEAGANYLGFTALTFRDGRLRKQRGPAQPFLRPDHVWFTQGNVEQAFSFTCTRPGNVTFHAAVTANRRSSHSAVLVVTDHYRWSGGGWSLVHTQKRTVKSMSDVPTPAPFAGCRP